MHLLRECVVYWYSLSNPRTKFIHYDNCLVIRSCAFPAFCLGQHAQGCTQASALDPRPQRRGVCRAGGFWACFEGYSRSTNKQHTLCLSLSVIVDNI